MMNRGAILLSLVGYLFALAAQLHCPPLGEVVLEGLTEAPSAMAHHAEHSTSHHAATASDPEKSRPDTPEGDNCIMELACFNAPSVVPVAQAGVDEPVLASLTLPLLHGATDPPVSPVCPPPPKTIHLT